MQSPEPYMLYRDLESAAWYATLLHALRWLVLRGVLVVLVRVAHTTAVHKVDMLEWCTSLVLLTQMLTVADGVHQSDVC